MIARDARRLRRCAWPAPCTTSRRRKDAEDQIRRLAYYDPLTGLPNRLLFTEQLIKAHRAGRAAPAQQLAIMFIDLDNFKRVNDTLGHKAGDELLQVASGRLSGALRAQDSLARAPNWTTPDSIARLGGDEFIVLLTDVRGSDDAALVAQRLVEALAQPVTVERHRGLRRRQRRRGDVPRGRRATSTPC